MPEEAEETPGTDGLKAAQIRAVLDMISGMTELAAVDVHARLTGRSPGSITDLMIQ
jgi:dGTP triphosphohydrolase